MFNSILGSVQLGSFQLAAVSSTAINEAANSVLSLSHSATVQLNDIEQLTSTLTFTQDVIVASSKKEVNQSLVLVNSVSVLKQINKNLSDSLNLFNVAEPLRLSLASSTLSFSQEATATLSIGINQSLTFTQDLINQYIPHQEFHNQIIPFVQTIVCSRVQHRTLTSTLSFTQDADFNRLRFFNVTQTFNITNLPENGKTIRPSDTLVLTQDLVYLLIKNQSVTTTLDFNGELNRQLTANFNLSDMLVFSNYHNIPVR